MSSDIYAVSSTDQFLHDHAEPSISKRDELDALVASGDCFVTLATQLDSINHQLATAGSEQPELERAVRALLYLQRHYTISKKQPDYRQ